MRTAEFVTTHCMIGEIGYRKATSAADLTTRFHPTITPASFNGCPSGGIKAIQENTDEIHD